jgi:hypothetical protein
LRATAALLALALVAGCASLPVEPTSEPIDPGVALLREHGWEPGTTLSQWTVQVGAEDVVPGHVWDLYLDASREVGLDFGALRGRPAELIVVELDGPRASLLVVGGQVVGAWVFGGEAVGCVPGIFPLSATRSEVESCG